MLSKVSGSPWMPLWRPRARRAPCRSFRCTPANWHCINCIIAAVCVKIGCLHIITTAAKPYMLTVPSDLTCNFSEPVYF